MTKDAKTTEFVDWLRKRIKEDDEILNRFKNGLGAESFALSFERSDFAFSAAARLEVYARTVEALCAHGSKATLQSVRDYALREVLNKAESPRRSSSPTSNIMAQASLAAWAGVLQYVDSLIK